MTEMAWVSETRWIYRSKGKGRKMKVKLQVITRQRLVRKVNYILVD